MRTMWRLACSVALRIASGTSRALPAPWPTRPLASPTTTRAAKPKRRPPFTTLATRLMLTSFSTSSLSSRLRSRSPPRSRRSPPLSLRAMQALLEGQAALAGGIGQGLHPAMEQIGPAVEDDLLDPGGNRALGHQLADGLGGIDIGAGLEAALHLLLGRGGGGQRHAPDVVDDLGIDMLARAEHREPGSSAGLDPELVADALAAVSAGGNLGMGHGQRPTSSCLPCARSSRPYT